MPMARHRVVWNMMKLRQLNSLAGAKERDVMERRRAKHTLSFGDRLEKQAEDVRAKAAELPPGLERDALLKRARQAEAAIHINDWLTSPGLQAPK